VTNRGTETSGALSFVCPCHDRFFDSGVLAANGLLANRQSMGSKDLDIVVEFLVNRRPIRKRLRDGMLGVGKMDSNWFLWSVPTGLQTKMLEPSIGARSETVHGAMQMHGWDLLVDLYDTIDERGILDVCSALVVDDDVILLSPIEF
jgi:hypothetical protein